MNYYNEWDPQAAAWLQELIAERLIPRGLVDERSITEVKAEDLEGFTQCHFFAGIGGWPLALQLAGVSHKTRLWTGSPPCQPFSAAGKQLGQFDPGISRQSSLASLASAALQSSLGNRLRQQLQNRGCAIYKLTWKEKITPSGLPYSQLVASAHRTKESDSSLVRTNWPTPKARDHHTEGKGQFSPSLAKVSESYASWPTPRSADGEKNVRTLAGSLSEIQRKGGPQDVAQAAAIASWGTPTVQNSRHGSYSEAETKRDPNNLHNQCYLVGPIRITASGQTLTGSAAGMENSGQLNPAHSRWLMGFPPEWDDCAVTAMQSFRKSLPNSSLLSWVPLAKRLRTKK